MLVTGIRGKFSIKEPVSNLVDDSVLYEVTSKVPIRESIVTGKQIGRAHV